MATHAPDLPPVADDDDAGVMGLTQVDPSPVDETPLEYKDGYFPPAQASRATTLGLGNHGPAYYRASACVVACTERDTDRQALGAC